MDYRLHRAGKDEGIFPLEELSRRRAAGHLDGTEYVWRVGMADWESLDAVLNREIPAKAAVPPPLPPKIPAAGARPPEFPVTKPPRLHGWVLAVIIGGVLLFVAYGIFIGITVGRSVKIAMRAAIQTATVSGVSAADAASRPAEWPTNSTTAADARARNRAFVVRQFLDGYEKCGAHTPDCDADARGLISNWIASTCGGTVDNSLPPQEVLADRLATNAACNDPLVLLVASRNTDAQRHDAFVRLEMAFKGFQNSRYLGYPKFYTAVTYTERVGGSPSYHVPDLDAESLKYLRETLSDGSLLPGDDEVMAGILLDGWAKYFFQRNEAAVISAVRKAGKQYRWLALVLEGAPEIDKAWKARGSGWANTVSAQQWKDFALHLTRARMILGEAWALNTNYPIVAEKMMNVALGSSGIGEMRLWFDRAIAAQMDDSEAWRIMRWGLRPRWFGSEESMLAFGVTALNTHRFDTQVPSFFFDSLTDIETEEGVPDNQHIYGRDDIWPHMREAYEGYIDYEVKNGNSADGWRSTYAAAAYLAGKYDISAKQLGLLNWKPVPVRLTGWKTDISVMALEVAARTGPLAQRIDEAETNRAAGNLAAAHEVYSELAANTNADERARAFIRDRLATLGIERKLAAGEWADLLPTDDLSGWCVQRGDCGRLSDGGLEVKPERTGHMLYSRAQVGTDFEVRGQFEILGGAGAPYGAGLVMGLPEPDEWTWDALRFFGTGNQGSSVAFSTGWGLTPLSRRFTPDGQMVDFDFRFQGGKVSATVGQEQVFADATPKKNWDLGTNEFHMGLGAPNNGSDATIRYHSLRIRRLTAN